MNDHAMTGDEKIEFVARQIADLREGETKTLACPYCQGLTRKGKEFCCDMMTKCVQAVLDREHLEAETRLQEAVMEACIAN